MFLLNPNRHPLQIQKICRHLVVDPNHSLWLSTSHLTMLKLHMILIKTSTMTDKSSSSQERLISLSPNLIFRTTPFNFLTFCPFCVLIGFQYTAKGRTQCRSDPLRVRVWLRESSSHHTYNNSCCRITRYMVAI